MPKRVFMVIVRLIDSVLFRLLAFLALSLLLLGPVVIFLLGLAASAGPSIGVIYLLLGNIRSGLVLLGIGAGAFMVLTLIWNRMVNAPVSNQSCGPVSGTISFSPLSMDFDS